MPDTVIAGRYRLEEPLGRGGMSEVYCAQDLELGRRVALKLLAPDADTARFEREARAVAALGHPNVMQLYDYGEDNDRPYMVLEYVPGGTLESRLADADAKPLPDDETRAIGAGIAAGLAHAHSRGVIHRDLKPANVLFDEEGRPKLADFGIARMAAREGTLTEAGTVLGTAAYISPEQASGEPATAASDVYSFGVILYRMLTGRLPFESHDPMELVMMNRDAPPPPITAFRDDPPGLLEATTMAALEKDPADRPQDGAALLAALGVAGATALTTIGAAAAATAEATRVLPTVAPASETEYVPPPPPPRGSRAPLLLAALIVLLLAGGALAYEVTKSDSSSGNTPSTLPTIDISTRKPTTTGTTPTTAPTKSTTTHQTTTHQTTTQPTTTARTTTAHTTTARATTTRTTQPTTTTPPPTTTTPPPTTTTPPPTTTAATTTTVP